MHERCATGPFRFFAWLEYGGVFVSQKAHSSGVESCGSEVCSGTMMGGTRKTEAGGIQSRFGRVGLFAHFEREDEKAAEAARFLRW